MATPGTLHDAFIDELRDTYSAEKQVIKALPKMVKAATAPGLRTAFQSHLEETRGHVEKLGRVFESIGEKPRAKHCDGMAGILEEGDGVMGEDFDDPTLDACLIASAQRVEHYEMAAYGSLVAWARAMRHEDAASILQEILDEEKLADEKLTTLAEGGINQEAADAAHPQDEDDEDDAPVAPPRASAGRAAKAPAPVPSRAASKPTAKKTSRAGARGR